MSGQVETLQGLLARVQHNRQQPRAEASGMASAAQPIETLVSATKVAAEASIAPEFIDYLPPVPTARPPAPPIRDVPAAAPPQIAAPPQVAVRHAPPAAPAPSFEVSARITATQRLSLPPAALAPAPFVSGLAGPAQGVVLAAPVASAPSSPIAVVVSPAVPQRAATFGDLLWRSLALRPR